MGNIITCSMTNKKTIINKLKRYNLNSSKNWLSVNQSGWSRVSKNRKMITCLFFPLRGNKPPRVEI